MTVPLRPIVRRLPLAVVAMIVALALPAAAQQTSTAPPEPAQRNQTTKPKPTKPAPKKPAPTPPVAMRQSSPDMLAYQAASKVVDPAEKLAALNKFLTDWPNSNYTSVANNVKFTLLIDSFPDRVDEIGNTVDQIVSDIAPSASPESRLSTVSRLVSKLVEKKILLDRARRIVDDAIVEADKSYQMTRARGTEMAGMVAMARGDDYAAERDLKDALSIDANLSDAPLGLAKIEARRGHDDAALDYYLTAAILKQLDASDAAAMRTLFAKVHGSTDGLDEALDKVYREKLPNPVTPTPYTPPTGRTTKTVLAEMFTGAGCPPCVSADLALEAVMERYPADAVIALAYHANIPQPDPMVVSGGDARRKYYAVTGVPTVEVDGLAKVGGGSRDSAPRTYDQYLGMIDTDLTEAPQADVSVHASREGETVKVTATASNVAAGVKGPRLHIVLAERELRFTGENNVRFHQMVVRGVAGDDAAGFAVKPTGDTSVEYTFDLAAIRDDITKTLAAEMEKRHKAASGAAPEREYKAEGHAMTTINPDDLVVVAFVQDDAKHVLQATRVVVPGWTWEKVKSKK